MEPGREPKSVLRAVLGAVALLSSLVVIPIGFVLLVIDLQQSMVRALAVLMTGGFLLALGIALLIWEFSGRYGIRR